MPYLCGIDFVTILVYVTLQIHFSSLHTNNEKDPISDISLTTTQKRESPTKNQAKPNTDITNIIPITRDKTKILTKISTSPNPNSYHSRPRKTLKKKIIIKEHYISSISQIFDNIVEVEYLNQYLEKAKSEAERNIERTRTYLAEHKREEE